MKYRRNIKEAVLLVIKGVVMGMANKIPGVSGGIIALAAGFYEELIYSFSRFDTNAIKVLKIQGFKAFYNRVNGSFLVLLFTGVGISFFTISLLLDFLIDNYPNQVLGMFYGMISVSVFFIWKKISVYKIKDYIGTFLGVITGITLLWISPGSENDNLIFVFFCGMLSISGMTLPGLSGSLFLLILGNYNLLLVDSVNAIYYTLVDLFSGNGIGWDIPERKRLLWVFIMFTFGSATGLVFFSKLLHFVLFRYHDLTISILVGFILGSLGSVWPWTNENSIGILNKVTLFESPYKEYFLPTNLDISVLSTLFFLLLGGLIVFQLERYGNKSAV